jgi:LytS/YehU family sensor histidine kinase
VENSIKHGFRGSDKMNISINVVCIGKTINITIIDNGAGYNSVNKTEERNGKGLQMLRDIFETYFSIYGKKIEYKISDLGNENSDGRHGTIVNIIADK